MLFFLSQLRKHLKFGKHILPFVHTHSRFSLWHNFQCLRKGSRFPSIFFGVEHLDVFLSDFGIQLRKKCGVEVLVFVGVVDQTNFSHHFLIHSQNLNQFPETRSTFTFWNAQCNEATQIHILPTICIARMAHAEQQSCAIWKAQSDKQQKLCLKTLIPKKNCFQINLFCEYLRNCSDLQPQIWNTIITTLSATLQHKFLRFYSRQ